MKVVKQEALSSVCTNERIKAKLESGIVTNCLNRKKFKKNITDPITNKTSLDHYWDDMKNYDIKGVYQDYPYEGIARNIPLNNHTNFYNEFAKLKEENWVNNNTFLTVFDLNLYSLNEMKYINLRLIYEFSSDTFIYSNFVQIGHGIEDADIYYAICLILAVIMIVLEFFSLKKSEKKDRSNEYERNFLVRMVKLYDKHFKRPGMFQFLCKKYNQIFLFFFFCFFI